MRLEPGPVPTLAVEPAQFEPDPDTFVRFEESYYEVLGQADMEIGALVDPAFEHLDADRALIMGEELDQAGDELDRLAGRNVEEGFQDVLDVREEVDQKIISATNEAVPESYQDVPPRFEAPPEGGAIDAAQTEPSFIP